MVCSSLVHEGEELLGLGGGPEAYAERGSSFGIPLLHPWANRLSGWDYEAGGRRVKLDRSSPFIHVDGGTGLPIHGLLAASRLWTVIERSAAKLAAALDFGAHAELLALFPFPHRLELRVGITDSRLTVRTVVIASGDVPGAGLVRLPSVPAHAARTGMLTIELPVRRRAVLDERGIPTGSHEDDGAGSARRAAGARAFDDSFDQLGGRRPVFSGRGRAPALSRSKFVSGWAVAQVYSPAGAEFICFEPMTAPVDALRSGDGLRWVQPGDAFEAEFAVSIHSR